MFIRPGPNCPSAMQSRVAQTVTLGRGAPTGPSTRPTLAALPAERWPRAVSVRKIHDAPRNYSIMIGSLLNVFVGTIVIARLDKAHAKSLSPMPLISNSITPFNKMILSKGIFVGRTSPKYKKERFVSLKSETVINDTLSSTNFYKLTCLYRLWGKEKRHGRLFIDKLWRNLCWRGPNELVCIAIFLVGVFPLFFHLGWIAKRVINISGIDL